MTAGAIRERASGTGALKSLKASIVDAFLSLVFLFGYVTPALMAQTDEELFKWFPYTGNWDTETGNPEGQDRGNCGGCLGDYGEKLLSCSLPVDQLPLDN
jgi:hypothetical protein